MTDGDAIESSDLDATALLTTLCPSESLLRRAGRCNRRGDLPVGDMTVFGSQFAPAARPLSPLQAEAYLSALRASRQKPFLPGAWKAFI